LRPRKLGLPLGKKGPNWRKSEGGGGGRRSGKVYTYLEMPRRMFGENVASRDRIKKEKPIGTKIEPAAISRRGKKGAEKRVKPISHYEGKSTNLKTVFISTSRK